MKAGSLERLPEPVSTEVASSWRDSSSWSKDREGGEGEEGAEGVGAFDDKGQAEAAANACGEQGREAGPAATEVGELGVCPVGRWVAEDFLQEREGSRTVRVGSGWAGGCLEVPVPVARLWARPHPVLPQQPSAGARLALGPRTASATKGLVSPGTTSSLSSPFQPALLVHTGSHTHGAGEHDVAPSAVGTQHQILLSPGEQERSPLLSSMRSSWLCPA